MLNLNWLVVSMTSIHKWVRVSFSYNSFKDVIRPSSLGIGPLKLLFPRYLHNSKSIILVEIYKLTWSDHTDVSCISFQVTLDQVETKISMRTQFVREDYPYKYSIFFRFVSPTGKGPGMRSCSNLLQKTPKYMFSNLWLLSKLSFYLYVGTCYFALYLYNYALIKIPDNRIDVATIDEIDINCNIGQATYKDLMLRRVWTTSGNLVTPRTFLDIFLWESRGGISIYAIGSGLLNQRINLYALEESFRNSQKL